MTVHEFPFRRKYLSRLEHTYLGLPKLYKPLSTQVYGLKSSLKKIGGQNSIRNPPEK
jgi:hypothetical protein